jgi:hypothetical protein
LVVGASLTTRVPIGQYYDNKLINLGTNRWSFRPEGAITYLTGRWAFDGYLGVWLFTSNDSFFPGHSVRTQDPIVSVQTHVSRVFRRSAWAAVDATWYGGGQTNIDGVPGDDRQRNARVGATVSVPLGRRQALRISYSTGAVVRVGGDFNTVGIAWQRTFF